MERFSKGLNRLLLFVPVLAAVVFAVLFAFVLKGRFYERTCHACARVLALRGPVLLVPDLLFRSLGKDARRHFLHGFPLCLAEMLGSACSAVFLTQLERYVATIHSVLGPASILAGAGMLVLFYAAAYVAARSPKSKRETDEA